MAVWWPRSDAAERNGCGQPGAGVFARFRYCEGMRQSILLKSFIIIVAGVAVIGGGVFVGFRHASEVRGDAEPLELSETYTHAELGFSFRYPRGFRVNEVPHGDGAETVLIEDPTRERQGFQVFSMPYDEEGPLTEARIRADLPTKVMEDVHPVQVDGVEGLAFTSDDNTHNQGLGRLFEVWTVHHGVLYQLVTYPELAGELQQVLRTWTFR
jgi:hypothetical protein